MVAVQVNNISKKYIQNKTEVLALEKISFDVNQGELFAVIGPDGAGKTTLFRILTSLILANEGTAIIDGFDVVTQYKEIRKRIGYMPGKFSLYQDLTVEENLNFFATIFNTSISANYDLIKDIYDQISPFKNRRAGQLSGGMKQKLALSCSLIHRPTVLFLDEPTTGVDAVSRKEFWEMLKRLKQQGITILVSTPYMDEASMCDRVALLQKGKILSIDTPKNIISQFRNKLWAIKSKEMYSLLLELRSNSEIQQVYPFGEFHHVITNNELTLETIAKKYAAELKIVAPDIEDCFIALMQENYSA